MEIPPKVWFRLQRLKAAWDSMFASSKQSYDTSHRMCPNCRALVGRNESECAFCGVKLRSARARSPSASEPGRILGILPVPSTASSIIIVATIAVYAVSLYLTVTESADTPGASGGSFGGISSYVLLRLGAKSSLIFAGQWWRLVTAVFLHAGLFHIGMNLWCLFDLGPQVESLFSGSKFTVFYLVTGVFGFVLSALWRPYGMSIGASGAVCGLIGVLIGASFHHGGVGKMYRSMLWRWVIYILIFGLFFAIDNAAHIGGLAAGLILGYLVPEGEAETRGGENLWNALALVSVLIIAGSFVLMAMQLNRPLMVPMQ